MNNGPVNSLREIEYSPYYNNFLYNKRTLSFYVLDTSELGDCKYEAAWFNSCYRYGYTIDMPQV